MKRITRSDITYQGRNDNGYHIFTCYHLGLGQFTTDTKAVREAWRLAIAHFNRQ